MSNSITQIKEGPKRITIEEHKARQIRNLEAKLTAIPKTEKPKHKRGGKLVRLRRRIACLRGIVTSDTPPHWERSNEIWRQIYQLEEEMGVHKNKKKIKITKINKFLYIYVCTLLPFK